jgi:hypothetical protein
MLLVHLIPQDPSNIVYGRPWIFIETTEGHGGTRWDTEGHGGTRRDTEGHGGTRKDTEGHGE